MRDFGDSAATRQAIYTNVLDAAKAIQPVSNARFQLALHDVDYEDPEHLSLQQQKKLILSNGTAARRLRGTWVLSDADGKEVERKRITLAKVPYLTQRGTFILNGTQNSLKHQMRLDPGIYTRQKENGELESHANVRPGKGMSHRYSLEPDTGVFKMEFAQSSIPLISVLKAFGMTDDQLRKEWGNELYAANAKKVDPRAIDKLYQKLIRTKKAGEEEPDKAGAVVAALSKMEFDPDVNKSTLGQGHQHLDQATILSVARKLLAVNRGDADTDDRDHLAYQHVMGPEDLLSERLKRPGLLLHQLLWRASTRGSLKSVPVNALDRHLRGAIQDSGLGMSLEDTNPVEWLDQQTAVTRLGRGGISSSDAVPDEARSVLPSHVGYLDLIRTPESFSAGVESRTAYTARKGSDGRLYAPYTNPTTKKVVYKNPKEVTGMVLAFPGEMEKGESHVQALVKGKPRYVEREKVDLVLPHAEQWFSPVTNLVPFKNAAKGQRVSMGSRFLVQALPLLNAEAPLVRSQIPGSPGMSFAEKHGKHMGAIHAKDQAGRVDSISPDEIVVRYADGTKETHELYNNFPNNRKTLMHNTPVVQEGDPIQPGQLLAKSNYTDDKGHLALGLNLRTAYMSWAGKNFEDATSISESAAKKLSSEHLYQHELEFDPNQRLGKKNFTAIFAGKFDKKTLNNLDDAGYIKPGAIVKHGDPLILAAAERPTTHKTVHASHKGSFADRSVLWEHDEDGVVTDVMPTAKGVVVAVKTVQPMRVGDKLSGVYGDKGIVGHIIPDHEMPIDPVTKQPYEVLANPLGIITRGNPAQMVEGWLGKIAAKTGKTYAVEDFADRDLLDWTEQELKKHGMSGAETVQDPQTGHNVNVATGVRYYMKLHHQVESKGQGRGLGSYTSEGAPAKLGGNVGSAKRLSGMDIYAILAHGATGVLRDARLIRGQNNQEYWATRMAGFNPPSPSSPQVYHKFIESLRASGINVHRTGDQQHLMALTDKHIDDLAENRELKNAETVDWQEGMKPKSGGLFAPDLTGGHGGNKWSYIKLHEPMPNPVFEDPIRYLLKLTGKQFHAVLAGQEPLDGRTGPLAIQAALQKIDVPKAIVNERDTVQNGRKMARDAAVRRLRYLKGLEKQGLTPADWMLTKVPVLPPIFRPISQMQSKQQLVSDANYLYKEVFDANQNLKDLHGQVDDLSEERSTLYKSFKALVGLGDPVQPKNQERNVKGLLAQVFGSSPKYGSLQRKLLGTTLDLVGRAVLAPNPDLSMDEIALPEARAWEVYSPFLVRRLVRQGVGRVKALENVENRDPIARRALIAEMDARPVMVSRAPVLHKFGRMAFFPRLSRSDTIQMSPLVYKPFNADNDGDMMNYEVVADDDAAKEAAQKMLPSRNLLAVSDFKKPIYQPSVEFVGGLHASTAVSKLKKKPRVFATKADAMRAWHAGELEPGDPVEIVHH
jgi:DNA-directed RNA polymerase beta subunit